MDQVIGIDKIKKELADALFRQSTNLKKRHKIAAGKARQAFDSSRRSP
jgi:hypothetical protein